MMTPQRKDRRLRRGFNLMEVMLAVFLLGMATVVFAGLYPPAARASHKTANYSQAISAVQHKVDELRSVGYGRLDYADLLATGIIDSGTGAQPYHFETTDSLSTLLPGAVGTITTASAGTNLTQVTVTITWSGAPGKAMDGSLSVSVLIANVT